MPIRLGGIASGLDTDAIVKELMSAQTLKKTNIEGNRKKLEWKKEQWEEMNTKLYALYTEKLSSLKLQGGYLAKKADSSDSNRASATATSATAGSYSVEIQQLAKTQYVTGGRVKKTDEAAQITKDSKLTDTGMVSGQTLTVKTGKDLDKVTEIIIEENMTVDQLMTKLNNAGLNAKFDAGTQRITISASASGEENVFTLSSDDTTSTGLVALGLENIDETLAKTGRKGTSVDEMSVVAAQDAIAVLNGAYIKQSGNTVNANGLSVELKGITEPGEEINIVVSNDVDAVYDKIKDFVKTYNELMTEMSKKYNAASSRGYAMLTDEQREGMSEEQAKLWDDKIKDSLLRRDDTLNSLMQMFRTSMQQTVEVDGKKYSLASFGIVTGAYTENGLLHINGDSEDGTYGAKDDQLKKAITEEPEVVSKVLSQIMSGFYSDMTEKMSANKISSALTFYNDKQIQSQIDDYKKQVDDWEDRLKDMEDRYYKQFSGMESAMATLQSQQSQLAGLFGG